MITMKYSPSHSVGAVIRAANVQYETTFKGLKEGVKECGELLLDESRKIVPIRKRVLHDSSRTRTVGKSKDTIHQEVEYRTPYALRQHEDLTYKHKPGKSAKYLEKPARRLRGRMADIVRRRARKK